MSKEAKLVGEVRKKLGTAECRRLRARGMVPGNVYGHHVDPLAVAVSGDAVRAAITARVKIVDLDVDGRSEKGIIRDVQWDTYGIEIQHFDLVRVDADERVTVEVPVELRGTAPGTVAGGMMEQPLHTLTIECRAIDIPDSIQVRVGGLELGQSIHVRDIALPPDMVCHSPPDSIVAHVVEVRIREGELEETSGPAEPELIARKVAEESEA